MMGFNNGPVDGLVPSGQPNRAGGPAGDSDWPIPLFRRIVRYAGIEKVEVGRTLILYGWCIHLSIRGGWVWNLWGRACVVVHFKNGGTLRIGTDDAENLAVFWKEKCVNG